MYKLMVKFMVSGFILLGFAFAQVEVLETVGYNTEETGPVFMGVVKNTSDKPLEYVEIKGVFKDEAGNVVGESFSYTDLDVLLPGETSPFTVYGPSEISDAFTYEYEVSAQESTAEAIRFVTIVKDEGTVDEVSYNIVGEVRNDGDMPLTFVNIIAIAYDKDDKLVGTAKVFADDPDRVTQPGETVNFDLLMYDLAAAPVSYTLMVQALPAE